VYSGVEKADSSAQQRRRQLKFIKNETAEAEAKTRVLEHIISELPPYFSVHEQKVMAPRTIYNLWSLGTGPVAVEIRGKKYLERESFVEFLGTRPGNMKKPGKKRAA
jgi:hypothetical protein